VFLGIVRGEIVSTINHRFYDHRRLLIVDRIDEHGKASGGYIIAVAAVDAGVGQKVLVLDEGNGARQVFQDPKGPVRSAVVGIVDTVDVPAPS